MEDFELKIQNCNSLKELRAACESSSNDVAETLQPVIDLLSSIVHRLPLKGKKFKTYNAADDDKIEAFWEILLLIDETITMSDTTKKSIKSKQDLNFIQHCCVATYYSFQIKKCGKADCEICKPVRMDPDVFACLHYLPQPIPSSDDHYKSFEEVYGGSEASTEKYRPSLQQ